MSVFFLYQVIAFSFVRSLPINQREAMAITTTSKQNNNKKKTFFVCLCLFTGNLFLYRLFCFSLGFPTIIVAISLAVTQANGYGNEAACWLDVESGLIWAFIAPALLVIVVGARENPFIITFL